MMCCEALLLFVLKLKLNLKLRESETKRIESVAHVSREGDVVLLGVS